MQSHYYLVTTDEYLNTQNVKVSNHLGYTTRNKNIGPITVNSIFSWHLWAERGQKKYSTCIWLMANHRDWHLTISLLTLAITGSNILHIYLWCAQNTVIKTVEYIWWHKKYDQIKENLLQFMSYDLFLYFVMPWRNKQLCIFWNIIQSLYSQIYIHRIWLNLFNTYIL